MADEKGYDKARNSPRMRCRKPLRAMTRLPRSSPRREGDEPAGGRGGRLLRQSDRATTAEKVGQIPGAEKSTKSIVLGNEDFFQCVL